MPPKSTTQFQNRRPDMRVKFNQLRAQRIAAVIGAILLGAATTACGSIGPKPWEHDLMAKAEMQLNPYPLKTAADAHIYFSKEASSGGSAFAGGGCGCN